MVESKTKIKILSLTLGLFVSTLIHASQQELRVASFNIRNYGIQRGDHDQQRILTNTEELSRVILKTKAQLIAVQEIVDAEAFKDFISHAFPNHKVLLSECGGRGKQKLGFVYQPEFLELVTFNEDERLSRKNNCKLGLRPAMIAHFKYRLRNLDFMAFSLHLKAGGKQRHADIRLQQYETIQHIINEYKEVGHKNFILMGDFNTTDYIKRNQNYQRFVDFMQSGTLRSLTEEVSCTAYWWGGVDDGVYHSATLDHIMISEHFYNQLQESRAEVLSHCRRLSCQPDSLENLGASYKTVSDHCPLVAELTH